MEQILTLINQYGVQIYGLLFAYCALKSGSLPLFAGFAAQQGALEIQWVMLAVLAGGYLGDEVRFWVTRTYGDGWIYQRPRLARWFAKARALMDRYAGLYIFLYRYPKGMRTVGALPVGLTDLAWSRFTVLNFASALTWTNLMVGVGFIFGASIMAAIESGWGVVSLLLLVALMAWGWRALARLEVPQNS